MTKTWLISPGTLGTARPLTEAVLRTGGRVVLAATSAADLLELADLADRAPGRVRLAALDADDPASAAGAVRTAVDVFGGLDVVVTAPAPVLPPSPIGACVDDVRVRLDAELLGTVALTRAALPVFRRRRGGSFLHLASPAAVAGTPGSAAAGAARRAVEGYLEALREEVATSGVTVTIGSPGPVPGDPERVARVLADVVAMEHPPLHLPLGGHALRAGRQAALGRVQELETWAEVSRSTDRAGAHAAVRDQGLAAVLHLAVPAA